MQQVFALQVDLRPAAMPRQAPGKIERSRAAGVVLQVLPQFRLKRRIFLGSGISRGQFLERRHQGFGNEHPSIDAEMPGGIGQGESIDTLGGNGGGHPDGQRGH